MNNTINYSGFLDLIIQKADATEANQFESQLTYKDETAVLNNTSCAHKHSDSASGILQLPVSKKCLKSLSS